MINLGDKKKNKITGITGIAISKVEYLTGCTQYGVVGSVAKDNKYPETHYLDIDRLVVVKKSAVKIEVKTEGSMEAPGAY